MAFFQIFSLFSRLIAGFTCTSLAMLVLFQLRHDKRSRLFAVVMLDIALIAFFGALSRFASALGYGDYAVYVLFSVAAIFTATLPVVIFTFVTEFLDAWTPNRRRIAVALAIVCTLGALHFCFGRAFIDFKMSNEGYVDYTLQPLVNGLLALGELGILYTLGLVVREYVKNRDKANIRLLVGFAILCIGFLLIIIPAINRYAFQLTVYAVSSVVMAGPILQQRLFDPLAQLNVKLARRAEQLSLLTYVGQQATSFLQENELLNATVKEIQKAFNYYAVLIYILNEPKTEAILRATASADPVMSLSTGNIKVSENTLVGSAVQAAQIVSTENVKNDQRYQAIMALPQTQSEVCIPLIVGSSNEVIGVLDIQSAQSNAFTVEDLNVLQILGQQLAIAIRNAELFEAAQRARRAAVEANEQKTKFLSEMSHELRTPLQVIIGHSEWILKAPQMYDNIPLPEVYKGDMRKIEQSGKHLHNLINGILDITKIEAGEVKLQIQPVDPVQILEDVQKTYITSLQNGVEIRAEYPEKLPFVLGDDLRIKQLLGNLVGNACKFTQQGSITLTAQIKGEHICFSVRDTGPGIAPEAKNILFRPYSQANSEIFRKYGGTGLGLYLCWNLARLHGGDIWFESEFGNGATFSFTIPLAPLGDKLPAKPTAYQASGVAVIFPRRQKVLPDQLLIIDSNTETRNQLKAVLNHKRYEVITATTAEQGLKLAAALTPTTVVVVTHVDDLPESDEISHRLSQLDRLVNTRIVRRRAENHDNSWQNEVLQELLTPQTVNGLNTHL